MKKLVIDRMEGIYAICEDAEAKRFAIPVEELPKGAREGWVLVITDAGEIQVDTAETDARKRKLTEKLNRVVKE